jgi:hypothetical protein
MHAEAPRQQTFVWHGCLEVNRPFTYLLTDSASFRFDRQRIVSFLAFCGNGDCAK